MGKRITGFFKPLIEPIVDAVDRTLVNAADVLVRNAGEGDSKDIGKDGSSVPVNVDTRHNQDHQESLRGFLNRRWRTNLHRRRGAVDNKRMRSNHNRVAGRPHG